MKDLILIRGISGSGKTTIAELITDKVLSADNFFTDADGNYNFDASKLPLAHKWCKLRVEHQMEDAADKIVVANTFTQEWEMTDYFDLAKMYGYRVHSLIVENRHGGVNVHNVPDDTIAKMKKRFVVKL